MQPEDDLELLILLPRPWSDLHSRLLSGALGGQKGALYPLEQEGLQVCATTPREHALKLLVVMPIQLCEYTSNCLL